MPELLPRDFIERKHFVNYSAAHVLDVHTPFSQVRDAFKAVPHGSTIPLKNDEALKTVSQDHWVFVPAGTAIEVEKTGTGEHWHYPVGMELVHRFMDLNGKPFLIRLMRHIGDDIWRFGAYEPAGQDGGFGLLKIELSEPRTVTLDDPSLGRLNVSFAMLPTGQCNTCHAKHGSPGQVNGEEKTEPCEFRPDNAKVRKTAERFLKPAVRKPAGRK